jgi:hypothetical protein
MKETSVFKVDDNHIDILKMNARKHNTNNIVEISSLKEFVSSHIHEFFNENIPESFKDLPANQKYFFGLIFLLTFAIYFCILVYDGYNTAKKSDFLSLQDDAGRCYPVLKEVTGEYGISMDGYWEGSDNFTYTGNYLSIYFYLTLTIFPRNDISNEIFCITINKGRI